MKVAIIDDLASCREEIRNCLNRYFRENCAGEIPIMETFSSGQAFLDSFTPETYDMILIDQYMDGLTGIETAREIRQTDSLVALLFVTVSRGHAIESYEVRACGYLVRPFEYPDFEAALELAGIEKLRAARFICIGGKHILLHQILWCNQDGHYLQVHIDRWKVLRFRLPFGTLSGLLHPYPQFLTCYKGCIVNMERVDRIDGLDFRLDTGERIPFSQRDRKKIETLYYEWLFRREREDRLSLWKP